MTGAGGRRRAPERTWAGPSLRRPGRRCTGAAQVLGDPNARVLETECQRHLSTGWGTYFGESILLLARLQLERRWLDVLPPACPPRAARA